MNYDADVKIGPIKLDAPFCQAGLAGYSDRAMRVVARRRGCPYAVTEALLDTIMLQGGRGLTKSIDINDEDHPVAGQIIGSEPQTMAPAASLLQQAGYDVIDLNFACPVKKIKNKARGGHMLRDVPRGHAILRAVRDKLPNATLSVSLRRAFDDNPESREVLFELLDEAWQLGYASVRVHGRTVEQKYAGRADWSILKELKQRYPKQTIVGSGDVFTAEDAVRMLKETGVDIVWIARGAIGNPWIFNQARALLAQESEVLLPLPLGEGRGEGALGLQAAGNTDGWVNRISAPSASANPLTPALSRGKREPVILPPTILEQRAALSEHFTIAMEIHGESLAGRRMRKMGIKYARFHPQALAVKKAFVETKSLREWNAALDEFYSTDGPGVWPAVDAVDEVNNDTAMQNCEAE